MFVRAFEGSSHLEVLSIKMGNQNDDSLARNYAVRWDTIGVQSEGAKIDQGRANVHENSYNGIQLKSGVSMLG